MDTAATAWLLMQDDHSDPGELRKADEPDPVEAITTTAAAA